MRDASDTAVVVMAVGDVFVDLDLGMGAFERATPLLATADVVVGNCEGVYADHPCRAPSAKHVMTARRARAKGLGRVPFHVMSCANNHIVDGGHEGLRETLETLADEGIATAGAGRDLEQAMRPAVLERHGVRIAFLSFATVFPVGYEARNKVPGLAPLRVRTFYAPPDPNFWEPGIEPVITTSPDPGDLRQFKAAIEDARQVADIVVVSCHWGYSSRFETLQDYETDLARAAVSYGADAVLCHHHHSLRGIEFVDGKPIFYGLGAFVHHFAHLDISEAQLAAAQARHGDRAHAPRAEYPYFPFHADARMTGIAVLTFPRAGPPVVGFVPAFALPDGRTEPLRRGDPRADQVLDYLDRITRGSGFITRLEATERDGWAAAIARPGHAVRAAQ